MQGLFSLLLFAAFFYFMMRFGCGAHMVHGHGGHGRHEHEGQDDRATGNRATDPVCGMAVAADRGYMKIHASRQYRFCSRSCLDKFEANPERYLTQAGGAR